MLKNKHIQTLYSTFFRPYKQRDYFKEIFSLSDGDFLECFWSKKPDGKKPIVILFHGLTGSFKSPYIQGVLKELDSAGLNGVVMHLRGALSPNKTPHSYHSGLTADTKEFINSLQKRFPTTPLFCVGYSLGANMMLKMLGELKENTTIKGAVSVSAPLLLDECANSINKGFSKFYQKRLLKELKKLLHQKYKNFNMEKLINFKEENIENIKTFWEFDEIYTAKLNGFKSAKEYYQKCSAKQFLKDIKVPTLIIHSKDDPFMNEKVIPKENEISKFITLEIHDNGGHVGFIDGSIFKPKYYLDKRVVEFLVNITSVIAVKH